MHWGPSRSVSGCWINSFLSRAHLIIVHHLTHRASCILSRRKTYLRFSGLRHHLHLRARQIAFPTIIKVNTGQAASSPITLWDCIDDSLSYFSFFSTGDKHHTLTYFRSHRLPSRSKIHRTSKLESNVPTSSNKRASIWPRPFLPTTFYWEPTEWYAFRFTYLPVSLTVHWPKIILLKPI